MVWNRCTKGQLSVDAMDPTETELQAVNNLTAAFDWAGVPADVRVSLGQALGEPQLVRDIVFVSRTDWDTVVATIKGEGPPPVGSAGPRAARDLTPIDRARLEMFRRACMLRAGCKPDTPGSTAGHIAPGAAAMLPASVATSPTASRKLKLSALVDQTLDAELQPLEQAEIRAMYDEYVRRYGDTPSPEAEPTSDQLAAVKQLLLSNCNPYVDFSVFGPRGHRLLRKMMFATVTLNAAGEWARRELPGPPTFEEWFNVFRCYRTTFLLLEAASAERLDGYCEHIRQFHLKFGRQCWDIIYMADTRMRGEEFERLRRKLHASPAHGYREAAPWSSVFAQAVKEDSFWTNEVVTPATLRLSQSRSNPIPDSPPRNPGGPGRVEPGSASDRKGAKRKRYEGDDQSQHDGKIYTHNRRGTEVCKLWNDGKCGGDKPQSKCAAKPKPRSHQCNLCLGPHQAKNCSKPK